MKSTAHDEVQLGQLEVLAAAGVPLTELVPAPYPPTDEARLPVPTVRGTRR